jgi:hypothetical protein
LRGLISLLKEFIPDYTPSAELRQSIRLDNTLA